MSSVDRESSSSTDSRVFHRTRIDAQGQRKQNTDSLSLYGQFILQPDGRGFANLLKSDLVEAHSAGVNPKNVERAIKAKAHYRRIRDEIKDSVLTLPESLRKK